MNKHEMKHRAVMTAGVPEHVPEPPPGSELEVIERAMVRTITEMEAAGGRPMGMIRAIYDDETEDMMLIYGHVVQAGLSFDRLGRARAVYLTERGRVVGPIASGPVPDSEFDTFYSVFHRTVEESRAAGRQELGLRFIKISTIDGLELYNNQYRTSACFGFDRSGAMWGMWPGWDLAAIKEWLTRTIPQLKDAGRI